MASTIGAFLAKYGPIALEVAKGLNKTQCKYFYGDEMGTQIHGALTHNSNETELVGTKRRKLFDNEYDTPLNNYYASSHLHSNLPLGELYVKISSVFFLSAPVGSSTVSAVITPEANTDTSAFALGSP